MSGDQFVLLVVLVVVSVWLSAFLSFKAGGYQKNGWKGLCEIHFDNGDRAIARIDVFFEYTKVAGPSSVKGILFLGMNPGRIPLISIGYYDGDEWFRHCNFSMKKHAGGIYFELDDCLDDEPSKTGDDCRMLEVIINGWQPEKEQARLVINWEAQYN